MVDGHAKLSYAQRMAEAHQKSAGLGEYTPKQSGTEVMYQAFQPE